LSHKQARQLNFFPLLFFVVVDLGFVIEKDQRFGTLLISFFQLCFIFPQALTGEAECESRVCGKLHHSPRVPFEVSDIGNGSYWTGQLATELRDLKFKRKLLTKKIESSAPAPVTEFSLERVSKDGWRNNVEIVQYLA
jgi:hypothetical protein